MSRHAHIGVRPRTVRPLGVRPQKVFVLTTDEHRWTQISEALPSCTRHGVAETLCRGVLLVAPKVGLSVFICVHLWLKTFPAVPPKKTSISIAKICENPCKTPHRQPSSTVKTLGAPLDPYQARPSVFHTSTYALTGYAPPLSWAFSLPLAPVIQNHNRYAPPLSWAFSLLNSYLPGRYFGIAPLHFLLVYPSGDLY
jgi:hypothetical protein